MIQATVVRDSISQGAIRLTTLVIEFPGFITDEVVRESTMLHTPLLRLGNATGILKDAEDRRFLPHSFNAADMETEKRLVLRWNAAESAARVAAKAMIEVAPETRPALVEALLAPFTTKRLLCTSASWQTIVENFSGSPTPEIRALAAAITKALSGSTPDPLVAGEWHLPFLDCDDVEPVLRMVGADLTRTGMDLATVEYASEQILLKVSAARCSRWHLKLSTNREVQVKNDLALFSSLTEEKPRRREYLEHINAVDYSDAARWTNPQLHGVAPGWISFRKVHAIHAWREQPVGVETLCPRSQSYCVTLLPKTAPLHSPAM